MTKPYFFTWQPQRTAKATEITGGEGVWFHTADGKKILDLAALSYQANVGHGEKRIVEAIKRQADELCLVMPSADFKAKRELAERLLELAPKGFDRVFFTLGGSEAVENAIKIARMVTRRHKLVSRYRSYHGASMGALTLSGDWRRPPLEPGLAGVVHAMDCYCDHCPFGQRLESCKRECASHIAELLDLEGADTVAAVFLEPVPGANGVLVPPAEYWPMVREATQERGVLLVADEVLTGFGRTGKAFAIDHWNVVPDMITVAKGLTAGYAPLGAVLVHERVSKYFDDHVLAAGLTAYAHPIGCAAGVATLDVYKNDGLFQRAAELGPHLLAEMKELPGTRNARGLGLLAAVEVELDQAAWAKLSAGFAREQVYVHAEARRGTIILSPPLCITKAEIEEGVRRVARALEGAMR